MKLKIFEYSKKSWPEIERRIGAASAPPMALKTVRRIVKDVRNRGDRALNRYTLAFDGARRGAIRVSRAEIRGARKCLFPEIAGAFRQAEKNIRGYYSGQAPSSWRKGRGDGLVWGEKVTPIESVGVYIPGGQAPLISTVFMTVIPAQVAGVPRIVLTTPPRKDGSANPFIVAAADFLRIKEVYKIGGAQAIAALAYGTESVPRVDKIVGPGNIYVTLAKKEVYGDVGIDLLAGPSEVVVLADAKANPRFIAADLLAQAEHGAGGLAILITPSARLIRLVQRLIVQLLAQLRRGDILTRSLGEGTFLIRVKNLAAGIDLANRIAPEHLEVMTENPEAILPRIRNAGAIFLGAFSPVAAGDYVAGPSHVLPTGRSARFFSHLSPRDFTKRSSVIRYDRASLRNDLKALRALAGLEGLDAHDLSAGIRFEKY